MRTPRSTAERSRHGHRACSVLVVERSVGSVTIRSDADLLPGWKRAETTAVASGSGLAPV